MRFLFLLIALVWLWMILRRIIGWTLTQLFGSRPNKSGQASVQDTPRMDEHRLVRDPECGVYIAENRALPVGSGAKVVHFCSMACRDRYFAREQKLAANA
jgi:hypothetical protein